MEHGNGKLIENRIRNADYFGEKEATFAAITKMH
jgi:hypothetical protein